MYRNHTVLCAERYLALCSREANEKYYKRNELISLATITMFAVTKVNVWQIFMLYFSSDSTYFKYGN